MGVISRWIQQASATTKVLMLISITTGGYAIHKYWYAPYARRQRRLQAEEWANTIIEREERMKENMQDQ